LSSRIIYRKKEEWKKKYHWWWFDSLIIEEQIRNTINSAWMLKNLQIINLRIIYFFKVDIQWFAVSSLRLICGCLAIWDKFFFVEFLYLYIFLNTVKKLWLLVENWLRICSHCYLSIWKDKYSLLSSPKVTNIENFKTANRSGKRHVSQENSFLNFQIQTSNL
jgi:hypothetical protein